ACVGVPLFLIAFLFVATLYIGAISHRLEDDDFEWWGRSGSAILAAAMIWAAVSALVIYGPWLEQKMFRWGLSVLGGAAGLLTLIGGMSKKTGGKRSEPGEGTWLDIAVRIAAPIALVVLLISLSWASSSILGSLNGML